MSISLSKFEQLKLDGVARSFGDFNALVDINITIRRGEFIALLGPSGCGKSTTLNCIAGLLNVTAGAIWVDDRRIDVMRPEDRGFGMVFQNYALFPHMNVRKNVGFGLRMRHVPAAEIRRRTDEAIKVVRLEGQEEKLPSQLSGGQQQRVAIARAIVVEPTLVLMDEPLSNLDAKLRLEMRSEIRRIHNELGATTIYVTHDQEEALSLADRIVVLRDGRIRQVGTPTELYDRPAHLDVAEFMGFRNRIAGVVKRVYGDKVTVDAGGAEIYGQHCGGLVVGSQVVVAVRPDDLIAAAGGPNSISTTVETMEYRGREFVGTGRGTDGGELVFRSNQSAALGSQVALNADGERALVFPRAEGVR
ncbi:ABC transporter ATP-binding protein [Devosia sp. 2618]|uniref:ABC transporter ATP-binding protein n=1 Tax=Devosia sp. 2618 TaxID=3156454 RepID=UPI00339AD771